jgi:nicotinamidase-related amidase
MADALLVVDVQRCFLNDFTHHVPARVATLIERERFEPILFTRFMNHPDSPYARFLDWRECETSGTEIPTELTRYCRPELTFSKPGLAGMPDELAAYLREHRIEAIYLAGIDTDMCVLKIAMDLFDAGIRPLVLADCCASTAGLQAHLAGLAVLSRNIGAPQLREAGLSGGSFAAP